MISVFGFNLVHFFFISMGIQHRYWFKKKEEIILHYLVEQLRQHLAVFTVVTLNANLAKTLF